MAAERHTVAAHRRGSPDLKGTCDFFPVNVWQQTASFQLFSIDFTDASVQCFLLQKRWENPAVTLACLPLKTARWENWRKISLVGNSKGNEMFQTKKKLPHACFSPQP